VDQPQFCDFPRTVMTPKCAINRFHLLLAQAYLTLLRQGAAHLMQCVGPMNGNSLLAILHSALNSAELKQGSSERASARRCRPRLPQRPARSTTAQFDITRTVESTSARNATLTILINSRQLGSRSPCRRGHRVRLILLLGGTRRHAERGRK
jgi:hypothetical protein